MKAYVEPACPFEGCEAEGDAFATRCYAPRRPGNAKPERLRRRRAAAKEVMPNG